MGYHIGDVVEVKLIGKNYSTYSSFFEKNPSITDYCTLKQIASYSTSDIKNYEYHQFKILYIGNHDSHDKEIAFIEPIEESYGHIPTFLVGVEGLSSTKRKYTHRELVKILGHEFDIVD